MTAPTTTPTSAAVATSSGPGVVTLLRCDRRAEEVTIANTGGAPASLSGWTLHDEGRRHELGLSRFDAIAPGEQLVVVTGPDAVDGPGRAVWKRQHVWNDDGDEATLIAPDLRTWSVRC